VLKHTTELHPDFLEIRRVSSTMDAANTIIEKKVKEAKQKDRVLEIKRRLETDSVFILSNNEVIKDAL
jgi:hypothetical protein